MCYEISGHKNIPVLFLENSKKHTLQKKKKNAALYNPDGGTSMKSNMVTDTGMPLLKTKAE